MTELSIGELDSLVLKAYRGAGFSWGLSQDAGRAAAWMAMRGLPAAECFAELLQQTDGLEHSALTPVISDGNWNNVSVPPGSVTSSANSPAHTLHSALDKRPICCPVIAGSILSDFGWSTDRELIRCTVYSPLILIPFVSLCAETSGTALSVCIRDESINLMANGQLTSGFSECGFSTHEKVSVCEWKEASAGNELAAPRERRATISDVAMERLETLAHRTYVPATELSRSGAGAGLTDND